MDSPPQPSFNRQRSRTHLKFDDPQSLDLSHVLKHRWFLHTWPLLHCLLFLINKHSNIHYCLLSGQNPLIWPLHIPIIQVQEDTKSISKLLQTPPNGFQTIPSPVHACQNPVQMRLYCSNTSPSPTFILHHFPLLATFVHSLLDNFFYTVCTTL